MRSAVADYEVLSEWFASDVPGSSRRWLCRPPDRLHRSGPVVVWELAVDADGWQQVHDWTIRFASAGPASLLDLIEIGPDLETGHVFLVSEEATDGTLAAPTSSLSPKEKLAGLTRTAEALHALHEVGLAHGAVRGDAIWLTSRGAVLAPPPLDLAAGQLPARAVGITEAAVDPDQLGGEPASRSSDIWSLGACVHATMSERSLYPERAPESGVESVQRMLFSRPTIDPELPTDLRSIVQRCLSPDPGDRPASARAVADALAACNPDL